MDLRMCRYGEANKVIFIVCANLTPSCAFLIVSTPMILLPLNDAINVFMPWL